MGEVSCRYSFSLKYLDMIRKGTVNCDVGVRRPELDSKTTEEAAINAVFQVYPEPESST